MRLAPDPAEVWVDLHYRYRGEQFRFNLPLQSGGKFLDGLRLDFSYDDIDEGRRLRLDVQALGSVEFESLVLTGALSFGEDVKSVFVNGYQSATGSRERSPAERISALNWPGKPLGYHLAGDSRIYPYSEKKGRFHGYGYSYIRYPEGLLFAGSLDESAGFTIIDIDLRKNLFVISKDAAGLVLTGRRSMLDLVLIEGGDPEVFDRYLELRDDRPEPGERAMLWTTGRENRGSLDEVKVRKSLAALRERQIPLKFFLVDDGWQAGTGDWGRPASGFPSGMASLATEIRGSGYLPGLRFAPFMVSPESELFRTHRDWLARDRHRRLRPVVRGSRQGGALFVLDVSRSDVQDYLSECVDRFRRHWGFSLIRADHLYAPGLYPPSGMSRGEAVSNAVQFLSSLCSDCDLELSGVPQEAAFGRASYVRVAADTTPCWEQLFQRNLHVRERSSTLNALRSTVGRRQLDGRFFASSLDAFRLSSRCSSDEPARRYTQTLIHYLLGSLISTGDDPSAFEDNERELFLSLFPLAAIEVENLTEFRRTVTIRYRVGTARYLSISNLAERMRSFVLPEGWWFGSPDLKRRPHHVSGGGTQNLRPGESRNYRLLSDEAGLPYAGSDGHLLPGCEIASVKQVPDGWDVRSAPGVLKPYRIWLKNPGGRPIRINGELGEPGLAPFGLELVSAVVDPEGHDRDLYPGAGKDRSIGDRSGS